LSDVTDRALALTQLKSLVQDTVKPVLSSTELDDLLDSPLGPQVKRASTWSPGSIFLPGQIIFPSKRNGHRYRCVKAGVTDNTLLGFVGLVVVTAGGSGYTSTPTVAFTGGGGSGASGIAIVQSGMVTGVYIANRGTGYTSQPAVGFSGGGGTGAAATSYVTGSEPIWPTRDGAVIQEGAAQPDGTILTWIEDGPDYPNVYDVRLAAHRGWILKSEKASGNYKISMGGQSFSRDQIYDHCLKMADSFAPVNF
jgi:hypothetical protein